MKIRFTGSSIALVDLSTKWPCASRCNKNKLCPITSSRKRYTS